MHKKITIFASSVCMAFAVLPLWAQREISSFEDIQMKEGENRFGAEMQLPDQYLVRQSDGTYRARRLTVTPATSSSACTEPYLQMLTDSSVYVCWKTTADDSQARVRYGVAGGERLHEAKPVVTALGEGYFWNKVHLVGLKPSTAYDYQVVRDGAEGKVCSFRTLAAADNSSSLRVLVIGDHQRNERSDYEWLCRAAERKAQEKWGDGSLADHVHFLLNVGDQVDGGYLSLYENVHLFKSRLYSASLPTMTCVGNHDGYGDSGYEFYSGHFPYSELSYKGISSGTSTYYAYQAERTLFVVLNSDGVSPTQNLWLRKVMAAADMDDSVDFIVAVQHRPLYAEQYCGDFSQWMLQTVMPIMEASPKFVLDLAGHHHLYARGQMTDTPVYHIITGGGVGTSAAGYEQLWGETPDNRDWDEVQKTIDQWTYQLMEFDYAKGLLTVETYALGNRRLAQDNVLVDRFTRCLQETARPQAPALADVLAKVSLPYTFAQDADVRAYATQFEVASDEAFTQVALNRVVTCENFYGVDDQYLPLDVQAGKPTSRLLVEKGLLKPGTYYVRTRNRNENLQWSDYSPARSFTLEGTVVADASLSVRQRYVKKGGSVSVRYSGAPVGQNAWIGIYHSDWDGNGASLMWRYTQDAEGTFDFSINDDGIYMAVLFADEGHDQIARSQSFIVSNNCSDEKPCMLSVEERYLPVGQKLKVRFKNMPAADGDWIGVYRADQEPHTDASLSWCYTNGTEGEVSLALPTTEGSYYVQYFLQGGYGEAAERVPFMVGNGVQMDLLQTTLGTDEDVVAIYEGVPARETVEMVVSDAAGTVVRRVPMDGLSGGTLHLGTFAPGAYACHVVVCTSGIALSHLVAFRVTESTSVSTVRGTDGTSVRYEAGRLHIQTAQGLHRVNVTSLDGRSMPAHSFVGDTLEWPLTLSSGIYLVCVDSGEAHKVVVK